MKVFITGAAGFIGSNLVKALLKKNFEVVGFDNLSQGSLLNLKDVLSNAKFKFVQADILDREALMSAGKNASTIFHLAAFKIPRYGNAYDTLHINSEGTQNVIELSVANKAHFIYASTSDVYGKNPKVPFSEEDDLVLGPPTVKRWSYAISKAFGEQMCFAEKERRGLDFTIVRFFGGYGPGQNLTWWGGPQSVFITQALDNQPLSIHGDGKQLRSFTFIDDHIQGLANIIGNTRAKGEVFNLGNDREITILEMAKLIWTIYRPSEEPKIEFIPYSHFGKYEDVLRRIPDLKKSKSFLDFIPKWTLEEGLKLTIEWQKLRRSELGEQ